MKKITFRWSQRIINLQTKVETCLRCFPWGMLSFLFFFHIMSIKLINKKICVIYATGMLALMTRQFSVFSQTAKTDLRHPRAQPHKAENITKKQQYNFLQVHALSGNLVIVYYHVQEGGCQKPKGLTNRDGDASAASSIKRGKRNMDTTSRQSFSTCDCGICRR